LRVLCLALSLELLTFTHPGADIFGSPWLEEEEKIGVCVCAGRKGVVATQCWAGALTAWLYLVPIQRAGPEDSGIVMTAGWVT
jgi:hypothetical protein